MRATSAPASAFAFFFLRRIGTLFAGMALFALRDFTRMNLEQSWFTRVFDVALLFFARPVGQGDDSRRYHGKTVRPSVFDLLFVGLALVVAQVFDARVGEVEGLRHPAVDTPATIVAEESNANVRWRIVA